MNYIERVGRDAIVHSDKMCYTFKVAENPRELQNSRPKEDSLDWVNHYNYVGDWVIHPYGDYNNLDKQIQRVTQNNPDAPGALKRKLNLLWGKGPKLYREKIKNNEVVREWVENKAIQQWLNSWNYEDYLLKCGVDQQLSEASFTKFHVNRGFTRLNEKGYIAKLSHCKLDRTRKVSKKKSNLSIATHALITDFSFETMTDLLDSSVYELFDFQNPFKKPTTVFYSCMYSFCQDHYTVPGIYGALEWIRRSNASPLLLKALSKNGINPSYHVESPQQFWDNKEEELKNNCEERGITYNAQMLADYEEEVMQGISKVLSEAENTGKFWHTKKAIVIDGVNLIEYGWTIKKIEQNVLDYIKAQILISDHASKKMSSAFSMNPAIGGTGTDTKVNSGAEQHYAMLNHQATENDITEMIVTKAINMAIKINFPDADEKRGFHQGAQPKRLEDTTPAERPGN